MYGMAGKAWSRPRRRLRSGPGPAAFRLGPEGGRADHGTAAAAAAGCAAGCADRLVSAQYSAPVTANPTG